MKRTRVPPKRQSDSAPPLAAESGKKSSGPTPDDPADQEESFEDYEDSPPRPEPGRSNSEATSAGADAAAVAAATSLKLIEVVKGNGKLIPAAVKVWTDKYEKNPKHATADLLVMLFEACGAKCYIDEELLDKTSVDVIVSDLVLLANEGTAVDYRNLKTKEYQNFKDNLVSFWDILVSDCSNGPLFDGVLFEKISDYVIALSRSSSEIYRLGASLNGLSIVTSLINVAVHGVQRETTQRRLNPEKKKRDEGPHVDSLNKTISVIQPKVNALEEMMQKIVQRLFVPLCHDMDSNIRSSCIQSLGHWSLSYPSLFLKNLYLEYLGSSLNDKNSGVRKSSVVALQNLYKVDDNVPYLSFIAERFSNRMIELAKDTDISVAVSAIGLINQLLSHKLLSNDDLGPIYERLVDDYPEIRHAIGELAFNHLIAQRTSISQTGEENDTPEVHLGRMLQILREISSEPILSTYVIDDIWEYMEAMKDWKSIISMLCDENPSVELTDEDATNLIRLLCASAKKAVGEKIVPAADNREQNYTKAQREAFASNRKTITIVLLKYYPRLLWKYMSDKGKISSLAEILLIMDLEIYSLKRQEKTFENVLELIKEAFFKHGEKDVLRSCVKAIKFSTTQSRGELQDSAKRISKEIEDELISKLKSGIKEVTDGEDEHSITENMTRLNELQLSIPVQLESLQEDIVSCLKRAHNRHPAYVFDEAGDVLVADSFFRDLAVKLAEVFKSLDILKIAKDCIEYAFVNAPKTLSFLEGAAPFLSKLPRQDKDEILENLKNRIDRVHYDGDNEEDVMAFIPYFDLLDSVGKGADAGEVAGADAGEDEESKMPSATGIGKLRALKVPQ